MNAVFFHTERHTFLPQSQQIPAPGAHQNAIRPINHIAQQQMRVLKYDLCAHGLIKVSSE